MNICDVWDIAKVPFPYANRPVQQERPALVVGRHLEAGSIPLLWVLMIASAAHRRWSGVTACNCSICRRYGVLWAYYPLAQVQLVPADAPTGVSMWDDRAIEFHRCRTCGCVSDWSPVDRRHDRMGVNARLMAPEILAQARIRHLDGANTDQYID